MGPRSHGIKRRYRLRAKAANYALFYSRRVSGAVWPAYCPSSAFGHGPSAGLSHAGRRRIGCSNRVTCPFSPTSRRDASLYQRKPYRVFALGTALSSFFTCSPAKSQNRKTLSFQRLPRNLASFAHCPAALWQSQHAKPQIRTGAAEEISSFAARPVDGYPCNPSIRSSPE